MKRKILTFRLDPTDEAVLARLARRERRSRSSIVRDAIARYAEQKLNAAGGSAFSRLERWVGCWDSGGKDLSVDSGAKFRKLLGRPRGTRTR